MTALRMIIYIFKVFLGQKYGYRPIPTYILSSELRMIRDELAATGHDPTLIDTWYRKDSNAVPPISVLQPISSILINFNNKVCFQSNTYNLIMFNYSKLLNHIPILLPVNDTIVEVLVYLIKASQIRKRLPNDSNAEYNSFYDQIQKNSRSFGLKKSYSERIFAIFTFRPPTPSQLKDPVV